MRSKSSSSMSDHEMIRAFHVEQRECELAHDVGWRTTITPDDRRSVLTIRLEAWEVGDPYSSGVPLAAFETSWPNAQVYSLTACLFNAAVKLTRLVEDSKRDRFMAETARR
jgi:hypothetical protein